MGDHAFLEATFRTEIYTWCIFCVCGAFCSISELCLLYSKAHPYIPQFAQANTPFQKLLSTTRFVCLGSAGDEDVQTRRGLGLCGSSFWEWKESQLGESGGAWLPHNKYSQFLWPILPSVQGSWHQATGAVEGTRRTNTVEYTMYKQILVEFNESHKNNGELEFLPRNTRKMLMRYLMNWWKDVKRCENDSWDPGWAMLT